MKEIPLTQGKSALVDDDDYEYLMQWKWRFSERYAVRWSRKSDGFNPRVLIFMHRVVAGVPEDMMADHKNGIELDNRKENLRPANVVQNGWNRKISKNNKCGFKGACLHNGRYQAQIRVNGKSKYLGRYDTPEQANAAYSRAAVEHFGEYAKN